MMRHQFEARMVEPVRLLMQTGMGLDVIVAEFSAGYKTADLVGAKFCAKSREVRRRERAQTRIDHHHWVEVLLAFKGGERMSFDSIQRRVTFSDTTLRQKVLPE